MKHQYLVCYMAWDSTLAKYDGNIEITTTKEIGFKDIQNIKDAISKAMQEKGRPVPSTIIICNLIKMRSE